MRDRFQVQGFIAMIMAGACAAVLSGPAHGQDASPPAGQAAPPATSAPAASAPPASPPAADQAPADPLVRKGQYLAALGDCVSCHTRPGGEPFAGGLPLKTPFGTIYTANITPDYDAGIGGWTEEQFTRALREGVADDGDHLYPAFPYTAYTKVTDDDVHAIYAYLKTLAPSKYAPPANQMSFPFGIRGLMSIWNSLFFKAGRYAPDAAQSAEWNRGAYLVQGLAHCGACHTPRNQFGAEKEKLAFTGAVYQDDVADSVHEQEIVKEDNVVRPWSTANLTSSPHGIGSWSVEEIATYLKTGHTEYAGAFGPMAEVIANSTKYLTDEDAHAMAVYLKSLPAAEQENNAKPTPEQMQKGEVAYTVRCGDCHQPTGLGSPRGPNSDLTKISPPLVSNAVVQAHDPATLINVILYGAHEANPGDASWPKMPGFELDFGLGMDDDQIAALATYVRNSWGNQAPAVDPKEVAKQR